MTERFPPALLEEIRRRTALVPLIGRSVRLRRSGREQVGLCPFHKEKTPSFYVVEAKGFAHCFGCGWHGGAIRYVMDSRGWPFKDAVEELAADAGLLTLADRPARAAAPPVARRSERQIDGDRLRGRDRAREIWREAKPAAGTLVETYLRARGIMLPPPRSLRFAPRLPYWHVVDDEKTPRNLGAFPAMVAAMQGADDKIVAVHITYLAPDGSAKAEIFCPVHGEQLTAKKMRGSPWGAAIRFGRPRPHAAGGEGIETVLSVMQALQRALPAAEFADLWFMAAGSIGNIAGAGEGFGKKHPRRPEVRLPSAKPDFERPGIVLPPFVTAFTQIEDGDNKDAEAAACLYQRAAARFARGGRKVYRMRPPAGMDFNDVLRGAA